MYKVISMEFKTGLMGGVNITKQDTQMEQILNKYEAQGFELVTISEVEVSGKNFVYRFVFKSK